MKTLNVYSTLYYMQICFNHLDANLGVPSRDKNSKIRELEMKYVVEAYENNE